MRNTLFANAFVKVDIIMIVLILIIKPNLDMSAIFIPFTMSASLFN
jgi:DNA polymerase sigma